MTVSFDPQKMAIAPFTTSFIARYNAMSFPFSFSGKILFFRSLFLSCKGTCSSILGTKYSVLSGSFGVIAVTSLTYGMTYVDVSIS